MRTEVIIKTWLTLDELDDAQREQAFALWKSQRMDDPWLFDDVVTTVMGTVEALVKLAGLSIKDWQMGDPAGHNYVRLERWSDHTSDYPDDVFQLSGARALAYWHNNVLDALRVPWVGPERWRVAKYGVGYRAGKVKPCPLTGMWPDDDALDVVITAIMDGDTLGEAIERLGLWAASVIEVEHNYHTGRIAFEDESGGHLCEYRVDDAGTVVEVA